MTTVRIRVRLSSIKFGDLGCGASTVPGHEIEFVSFIALCLLNHFICTTSHAATPLQQLRANPVSAQ